MLMLIRYLFERREIKFKKKKHQECCVISVFQSCSWLFPI